MAAAGSNCRRNGPPTQHQAIRSTALAMVSANVQLIAGRTVNLWLLIRTYASASRRPPESSETQSSKAISGFQHAAGGANVERTGWKLNQQQLVERLVTALQGGNRRLTQGLLLCSLPTRARSTPVDVARELELRVLALSSDLRGENKIRFPATKPAVTVIAAATSRA